MAIPKKGSRPISINGIKYRWYIRLKPTVNQIDYGNGYLTVAVDLESNSGTTLVISTVHRHPNDLSTRETIPITPSLISKWIQEAIELGWDSCKKGKSFHVSFNKSNQMCIH